MSRKEQHYTCKELALKWHVSQETVRPWCEDHGGILAMERPETMDKRRYRTIRIPESAADQIYTRHFLPPKTRKDGRQWSISATRTWQTDSRMEVQTPTPPPAIYPRPGITIFAECTRECKYRRDATFQRCDCPKSFSFTDLGMRCTLRSGTQHWNEAEEMKQQIAELVARGVCFDVRSATLRVREARLLHLVQASEYLGYMEQTILRMIDAQQPPVVRFGKHVYVNRTELDKVKVQHVSSLPRN